MAEGTLAIPSTIEVDSFSDDLSFQRQSLQDVSRTFALTIPELPQALRDVVGNAYLLCRLADTIEDDADLSPELKRRFSESFIAVVEGTFAAKDWSEEVLPQLAQQTPQAELELVAHCDTVLRITRTFAPAQQAALARCVGIMARGMADYQDGPGESGLDTLRSMDRYCYFVAGVVGEMLTELFCDYSPSIARQRAKMMELAVSFGQGLQMTNILKDVWDDHERGACWLPQDVFAFVGAPPGQGPAEVAPTFFEAGIRHLVGVAHAHLRNALDYTLMIPKQEAGIRRFCLWALGMAVLTLRKIHDRPPQGNDEVVKISRRTVKATVLATSATATNDWMLRRLFAWASHGLPIAALELPGSAEADSSNRRASADVETADRG